jgi:hypothetical protein
MSIAIPASSTPQPYHCAALACRLGLLTKRGLTTRRLTFREIFSSTMYFLALRNVTFVFFDSPLLIDVDHSRLSMAA